MHPSELYDRDYYAWIQHQVQALRERRIEDVDWANAAEEIEDLGKSEKRGIRSQLARLLEHLLKLQYARSRPRATNRRGWELSTKGARIEMERLLNDSASLRVQLPELLAQAYRTARLEALRKARLSDETVPESSPWTVEQVMDNSFLPAED
jgi:hypothetical protein